ncbi:MAG TPA: arylesterase [Gemmatimonadaceae bacterium]|nr:arylesterase [Gemmatimonadaceae bacterium]
MSIKKDVRYMSPWTTASLAAALLIGGCNPAAKDKTPQAVQTVEAAPPDSASAPDPAAAGPTVLFIGTSLTAGLGLRPEQAYPALIQAKADSAGTPLTAVNAGVSGETSAGALNRIDWVLRSPADVVVLETGANDALRALPVSEARSNIAEILDRIKAAKPHAKIFLIQMEAPPNLGQQYTTAFHKMYADLAREKGATLIPFLLNGVAGHADLNQADGLHPNVTGEEIVATNVWNSLKKVL